MSDINEIKEALSKATPGIWWHYQSNNSVVSDHKDLIWGRKTIAECNSFDDAKLLANAPEWISSLITTIESQKEEIEKYRREAMNERELGESIVAEREQLYTENESLKAITELAVKGLEKYGDMIVLDSEDRPHDVGMVARETLFEIERLQNDAIS